MRSGRYIVFLVCLAAAVQQPRAQSSPLAVERHGSYLQVSCPQLHFLYGKPLEQLHDGATVTYDCELTLVPEPAGSPVARVRERFIYSFDLWEERFSVVKEGTPPRTNSHLTAPMAEAWTLDNLQLPLPTLRPEKPFVLKLECWIADSVKDTNGDGGLTLSGLIDALSRKAHDAPLRWEAISRAVRLSDLR